MNASAGRCTACRQPLSNKEAFWKQRYCDACSRRGGRAPGLPEVPGTMPPFTANEYRSIAAELVATCDPEPYLPLLRDLLTCYHHSIASGETLRWNGRTYDQARASRIPGKLMASGQSHAIEDLLGRFESGDRSRETVSSLIYVLIVELRAIASSHQRDGWAYRWHCWQARQAGMTPSPPQPFAEDEVVPEMMPIRDTILQHVSRSVEIPERTARFLADFCASIDRAVQRDRATAHLARAPAAPLARGPAAHTPAAAMQKAATTEELVDALHALRHAIEDTRTQRAAEPGGPGAGSTLVSIATGGALGYWLGRNL